VIRGFHAFSPEKWEKKVRAVGKYSPPWLCLLYGLTFKTNNLSIKSVVFHTHENNIHQYLW